MSQDRDVVLKIGTKLQYNADDSLKRIGAAAKDADREVSRLFQGMDTGTDRLTRSMGKLERSIRGLTASFERMAKTNTGGAAAGGERGGAGGGLLGAMMGGSGAGLLGAALVPMALAAANQTAQVGVNSFDMESGFQGTQFRRGLGRALTPDWMYRWAQATSPVFEGERQLRDTERRGELQRSTLGLQAARDAALMGLRGQEATATGTLRFGATSAGQQFELSQASLAFREQALRNAGSIPGYARGSHEADILRRAMLGEALGRQGIESQRQLGILGVQQGQAGAEVTRLEERLRGEQRQLTQARGTVGAFGLGTGPVDAEARANARLRLEQSLARVAQTQKELEQAKANALGLQQQRSEMLLRSGQERLNLLQGERNALSAIAQQERSQLKGYQEQFGLQTPLQRRQQLAISQKIAAGQNLTRRELESVRGNPMFSTALAKIGAANAGPEFNAIVRNLGLENRAQAAEAARLQLDNQIKVQIEMNAQSVSDQLQQQVVPRIHEIMQQVTATFRTELERVFNQQRLQRRTPGQP